MGPGGRQAKILASFENPPPRAGPRRSGAGREGHATRWEGDALRARPAGSGGRSLTRQAWRRIICRSGRVVPQAVSPPAGKDRHADCKDGNGNRGREGYRCGNRVGAGAGRVGRGGFRRGRRRADGRADRGARVQGHRRSWRRDQRRRPRRGAGAGPRGAGRAGRSGQQRRHRAEGSRGHTRCRARTATTG